MIRTAVKKDIPRLIALLEQLFSIEEDFVFDRTRQQRGLELLFDSDMAHIFAAEEGGIIIGMVTGQLVISTAEGALSLLVEDMVVDASQRHKGVGRSLLQALGMWAEKRGARRMQLLADLDNQPAFLFYERAGWSKTNLVCLRTYNRDKKL